MKSFVLSLVLLLTLGAAGSGPAAAAVSSDTRETPSRSATYRDSGTHLQRQRVARASINDSDDYYTRYDRSQSYKSKYKSRKKTYAKRTTTRTASGKVNKKKAYIKNGKRYVYSKSKRRYVVVGSGPRRIAVKGHKVRSLAAGTGLLGVASYYWQPQRVAAGGWFDPMAMTAAHKSLPFGTRVRVTHLGNGRSVDVKINDRGPYIAGRIIDLSKGAAGVIGMQGQGIAKVKVTVLGRS